MFVHSGQGHKCINILGIIGLTICFILTAIFNALAGSGNKTFFNSVTGNISDKYELDTTPAGVVSSSYLSDMFPVTELKNVLFPLPARALNIAVKMKQIVNPIIPRMLMHLCPWPL